MVSSEVVTLASILIFRKPLVDSESTSVMQKTEKRVAWLGLALHAAYVHENLNK